MDVAAVRKFDGRIHVCVAIGGEGWGRVKSCDTLKWLWFLLTQTELAWKVFALEGSAIRTGWTGLFITCPGRKACEEAEASAVADRYRQPLLVLPLSPGAHLQIGVRTVSGLMFPFWTGSSPLWSWERAYDRNCSWGFSWSHRGRKVKEWT